MTMTATMGQMKVLNDGSVALGDTGGFSTANLSDNIGLVKGRWVCVAENKTGFYMDGYYSDSHKKSGDAIVQNVNFFQFKDAQVVIRKEVDAILSDKNVKSTQFKGYDALTTKDPLTGEQLRTILTSLESLKDN